MTYPQQGQPGDPYNQPPGGYQPGQAGPEYPQQPQYHTQPDMGQQPGYPQQPGYHHQQPLYQDQYGQQYGPPPVPPDNKGGAGTAILIVVVVLLLIGGGAAGYFLLGDDDEGTTTAGDEETSASEEAPTEEGDDGEEPTEDEEPTDGTEPSGDTITVDSLGAATPLPGSGQWDPYQGPATNTAWGADATSYVVQHDPTWISLFGAGMCTGLEFPYDPDDLSGSAAGAVEWWAEGFSDAEGMTYGDPELTEVEVDGRPGVLAETRIEWDSYADTDDTYEDAAVLIVDADGVNGFIGIASIPESGADFRQEAVDALLATTFEGETA
ncbi:hypothetical protein [Glycomyces xiaoerkulensis]|uniref:hypothetical protein n=1 Tax=Glycomyces xiaoerkulensis TaxID=2038139 RepID=UPI000C2677D1|nr:hypothetical protein [Glycomyces xiaoerkulensis]